jgi:hypothetical protein
MKPWHWITDLFPTDGSTVWVRRGWLSAPFQAVWSSSSALFTVAGVYTLPWYVVAKWREI